MNLDGHRLTNARLADGNPAEIVIEAGLMRPATPADGERPVLDLAGRLVLPGFVESHIHLDKTLLGTPWRPHDAAPSVAGRVAAEKAVRRALAVPVEERGAILLRRCLASGVTRLRTHVDLDEVTRLDNLHALLRLREDWADRIGIEIVAFPQSGILRCPPAADLMAAALAEGADLVGGLDPATFDGDREAHLDTVFGLAERTAKGIDIHLHEGGETGLVTIEAIAARTRAASLGGRVTISHAFGLADAAPDRLDRISTGLEEAGVTILSSVPGGPNCPPLPALRERGVAVVLGTDNVRDAWSPMNTVGMIDRMYLYAYRFGLRTDEALASLLELVTDAPRRLMGDEPVAPPHGPADLVVVAAEHVPQMIVDRVAPDLVIKAGRVVRHHLGDAAATEPPGMIASDAAHEGARLG